MADLDDYMDNEEPGPRAPEAPVSPSQIDLDLAANSEAASRLCVEFAARARALKLPMAELRWSVTTERLASLGHVEKVVSYETGRFGDAWLPMSSDTSSVGFAITRTGDVWLPLNFEVGKASLGWTCSTSFNVNNNELTVPQWHDGAHEVPPPQAPSEVQRSVRKGVRKIKFATKARIIARGWTARSSSAPWWDWEAVDVRGAWREFHAWRTGPPETQFLRNPLWGSEELGRVLARTLQHGSVISGIVDAGEL